MLVILSYETLYYKEKIDDVRVAKFDQRNTENKTPCTLIDTACIHYTAASTC